MVDHFLPIIQLVSALSLGKVKQTSRIWNSINPKRHLKALEAIYLTNVLLSIFNSFTNISNSNVSINTHRFQIEEIMDNKILSVLEIKYCIISFLASLGMIHKLSHYIQPGDRSLDRTGIILQKIKELK